MAKKPTKTQQILSQLVTKANAMTTDTTTEDQPVVETFPGGRLTLLPVPDRKELPPYPTGPGRRSLLIDLCLATPDTYAQFITYIQSGAYYHVAAESIGIASNTLRNWLELGRRDLLVGEDSWYSRLLGDIRRAVAVARVGAEITIANTDSRRWLNMGPGKMFGDEWLDSIPQSNKKDDDSKKIEHENQSDLIGEIIVEPLQIEKKEEVKDIEVGHKTVVLDLDPAKELAALEAMEQCGLADNYMEAQKEALRNQINQGK